MPEVDLECLLGKAEAVGLIKHLDASLGRLNVLVKDEADFVVGESLSVDLLLVILQFDGGDLTSLRELGLEFFLSDLLGDESHENV